MKEGPLPSPWSARLVLALGAALAVSSGAGPLAAQSSSAAASARTDAAATITAEDLRLRVGVLAHDSMAGRDTPSPGLEKAARYVAAQFRSFGLRPGAGEGYLQRYPITVVRPGASDAQGVILSGPAGEVSLDPRTQFVAVPVADRVEGEGALVAIGSQDGTTEIRGRVAVVRLSPRELQAGFGRVRELFTERGAVGAILVLDAPENYVQRLRLFFASPRPSLGETQPLPAPLVLVGESALPRELASALAAGEIAGGWSAHLWTTAEVESAEAMNTIGVLEGSDPLLRNEYVIFTAHMDHVGVGRPVGGDSIYNGADDDASGTSTIVELAEAFAATRPRPRRSLIFLTVSGEEKGLWGSRWYTENPPFPLGRTVADLNIDMIGRNWQDSVVAIGKQESSLGPLVDRVAAEHPELHLRVIDDQWPEQRFYFRSDHYNFARKGVPILFFFSGVHEDYHRPSDEPGKLEYEKMARIGRLIYYLGREVADAERRPVWDEEAYERVVEGAGG
ncbi:MAG: M28 family peptidase [Gemmatimonadota bacterium]